MEIFALPNSTRVQRVIPKNAFDSYTTSKQKKLFTDLVFRITWINKLSPDTANLPAKDVKEIQVIKIELKAKEDINPVLDIIDKAIPYNIIFVVEYDREVYLSTSAKHPHPANEDNAVIDWTFKTEWFSSEENKYQLQLKKSLDAVYLDFCIQISDERGKSKQSLQELVQSSMQIARLEKEIEQLKKSIRGCQQFKNKVELNILLRQKRSELKLLVHKS